MFTYTDIHETFDPNARIVLYPGDCLELLRALPDNSIQLVLTSPPYNIGKIYEEKQPLTSYLAWQKEVITECHRVLKNEGSICWQVGHYAEKGRIIPLDILLYPIFDGLGMKMRNRIIWHFEHGLHAKKGYQVDMRPSFGLQKVTITSSTSTRSASPKSIQGRNTIKALWPANTHPTRSAKTRATCGFSQTSKTTT